MIAGLIGSVVVPKSNSDGEVKCGERVVVTKGGRGCGRIAQWAESVYWRKLSRRGLEADSAKLDVLWSESKSSPGRKNTKRQRNVHERTEKCDREEGMEYEKLEGGVSTCLKDIRWMGIA